MRSIGILLALLLASGTGCTHGKSKPVPGAGKETTAAPNGPAAPPAAATADKDWLEGNLPKSELEGTPKNGGQITVRINAEPPSLNSTVDSDWLADYIAGSGGGHVYEGLLKVDPYDAPRFQLLPSLAESWEISDDKLTYTFHLRHGVKFHDGSAFSAHDVIATFDKIMDETTKAAHLRSYLEEMKGYKQLDEFTVRFDMKRPYFLALETLGTISIQPASVIAKLTGLQYNEAATNPINRAPIGTGPFKFKEWQSKQRIVLERNPDYWKRAPYLDRVTFRIVEDPTVSLELTERGEIDLYDRVIADQWVNMVGNQTLEKNFNRARSFPAHYQWIGWNEKAKPFLADKRVRRALTMLIDVKGFGEKLLRNLPKQTTCHFYWAGADCDPDVKPLPFDPEAAEKLLTEAGWSDHDNDGVRDKGGVAFRFNFMIPVGAENSAKLATFMKETLTRAGIDMQIQKVEWSAFSKRLREHSFDACTLAWGGGARDDPTQIWHSKSQKGGSNYISYANPEADKLMEDARVTFDDAKRVAMFHKLHRILYDDQPYTWLYNPAELALVHKRIKGARDTLYWWQYEDLWIDPSWK